MTKANDLAFPVTENDLVNRRLDAGLTKREYFASLIYPNLAAQYAAYDNSGTVVGLEQAAEMAVAGADALINALNKG